MYDLKIEHGSVFDGTGAPAYRAHVAAVGGEIVAIGSLEGEARKVVDATGLAVSPGFIDLHTHSDMSFLLDSTAQSKVRQGVTLELAGNCGMSFCAPLEGAAEELLETRVSQHSDDFEVPWTDFGGYLDAVERSGSTLNLAVQVGHGTVRSCVVGLDARAPDGAEMDRMKRLVVESLDAGAMGFSTGLFYAPGNYARLEEVIELAEAAAERGKVYSTHMRDEGSHSVGLFVALNEAIEIGRRTGVRGEGLDIAGHQYPYTAGSTALTGALFPRWALDGGREATLERMGDSELRPRLLAEIDSIYLHNRNPEGVVIARFVPDPHFEGMNMLQISEELGCGAAEAALRLYEMADAQVIIHMMQDADVDTIAGHPLMSDGSSISTEGVLSVGKPHPRSYGTNPRFLANFVRDRGVVTLEEAVRRMTLLPATRMSLSRRDRIAPGFAADLLVFDPETVADTATFESPHSYAAGVPHVAVNGELVVEAGQFTGRTPGKVIRGFGD